MPEKGDLRQFLTDSSSNKCKIKIERVLHDTYQGIHQGIGDRGKSLDHHATICRERATFDTSYRQDQCHSVACDDPILVVACAPPLGGHRLTCDGREADQKTLSLAGQDDPTCNFQTLLQSRQKTKRKQKCLSNISQLPFIRSVSANVAASCRISTVSS